MERALHERAPEGALMDLEPRTFELWNNVWRICDVADTHAWSIADAALEFAVSSDEEHVHVHMLLGGKTHDLGARSHHYLLLTLARRRMADSKLGFPESSCGWVHLSEFEHDPSMGSAQLNLSVFRIREQLAAHSLLNPKAVIERRPRSRELRIGIGRLAVRRL